MKILIVTSSTGWGIIPEMVEEAINHGRYAAITARGFIEMQGGLPIVVDGEVIGGIGASFATPEEDEQVAKAGLAALTQ